MNVANLYSSLFPLFTCNCKHIHVRYSVLELFKGRIKTQLHGKIICATSYSNQITLNLLNKPYSYMKLQLNIVFYSTLHLHRNKTYQICKQHPMSGRCYMKEDGLW